MATATATRTIEQLQAKDFIAWLRRIVREHGRKAEIGNENDCPVEVWAKELGFNIRFIAGGEVELEDGTLLTTEWASASYYMFREDGHMEVKAGKWLDIMTQCENPEAYLITPQNGITTEQMNDLMPFVQQYQQEKRDAESQRQAEIDAAKETPNYETTAKKTRKPRKSADKEPQPIITITRHSWNHISRVCYRSWASKPLSQKDELAYKKAITANQPTEYEAREYNGRLYRVYQTIIEDGKARCCSCPAVKPCKHMKHYEQVEEVRGAVTTNDHQEERETCGMPLEDCAKSVEIAKQNMVLTSDEEAAREAYLAAKRAESEAELARIEQEMLAQIETEQAAPQQPRSEMARIADLDESDEEAKIERWTDDELLKASLGGYHRDGRIMPPPMSSAPTCRKVSVEWLCNRY